MLVQPRVSFTLVEDVRPLGLVLLLLGGSCRDGPDRFGQFVIGKIAINLVSKETGVELLRRKVTAVIAARWLHNNASGMHGLAVWRKTDARVVVAKRLKIAFSFCFNCHGLWARFVLYLDLNGPGRVHAHQSLSNAFHMAERGSEASRRLSYLGGGEPAGSRVVLEVNGKRVCEVFSIDLGAPAVVITENVSAVHTILGNDVVLG